MTIDRDALAGVIHNAAMGKGDGEKIFESKIECVRLADAVIAHLSAVPGRGEIDWSRYIENQETGEVTLAPELAVPAEGDREALNVEREKAAAEHYPDIEADPPGTATEDARFPTGWSRDSEREAFVTGAEWAAGSSRSPLPVEGEVEWEYAHEYTDEGGGKHRRKVSASEYAERKPDGHRADGSPYWNYTQKRRRKAGKWMEAPNGE